jgi:glutamine amidotransferase
MNENKKVAIIDYGLGNLFSVKQACESLGFSPFISASPRELKGADAAILPGVGAFKAAMNNLTESGMKDGILHFVQEGKPIMGVCLGLQLLFEKSVEFENCDGLGLIEGTVNRFPFNKEDKIKVPQISWNKIFTQEDKGWQNTPLENISDGTFMYFVHSYYVNPTNEEDVLTKTTYHTFEYCSAIKKDNIFATQFHPEKSGTEGLSIYKSWLENI